MMYLPGIGCTTMALLILFAFSNDVGLPVYVIAVTDQTMQNPANDGVPPLAAPPLRIAAFNIQIFGKQKLKDRGVTGIITKILQRYDVVMIQEIRDKEETSLDSLLKTLNRIDPDDPFQAEVSERLGRTNSKEQYGFLYRPSRVGIADVYQYDDGKDDGTDVFEREPFAIRFSSPRTEIKDFAMIAIHTSPGQAVKEISGLLKVYEVTKKHWGLEDIIIAGDFNADGDYVGSSDWEQISLRSDRRFAWLIGDTADTTVGSTDYSYDRFVVAGKKLRKSIVPGSTKVFKFDDEFGLTYEQAQSVSDHYPIELEIAGEVDSKLQRYIDSEIAINIKQKSEIPNVNIVRQIYRSGPVKGYQCVVKKVRSSMLEVTASKHDVIDVIKSLQEFQTAFPDVLRNETIAVVSAYLSSEMFHKPPYVYGLMTHSKSSKFDIDVTCRLKEPLTCCVSVKKIIS